MKTLKEQSTYIKGIIVNEEKAMQEIRDKAAKSRAELKDKLTKVAEDTILVDTNADSKKSYED